MAGTGVAATTALALATAALVPKLRYLLWGYAVVIDVILGFVLGWLAVRTTIAPGALRESTRTA